MTWSPDLATPTKLLGGFGLISAGRAGSLILRIGETHDGLKPRESSPVSS
jgi:hypothetical protein